MLYLASASPRRRELLQQIGQTFTVRTEAVDETPLVGESPEIYVARLALAKAQAVAAQCQPADLVLAADTTVVYAGQIIGKPASCAEAVAIWSQLSGRTHQVLTGIAVVGQGRSAQRVVCTEVSFRELTLAEMQAYWHTGEPCDKAGGYGIQGRGALWVERIVGSYSNVVGLPLCETAQLLAEFGVPLW